MKYTRFTHEMDVFLLERMQETNPLVAPHGTRLAAWKEIAQDICTRVCNNPTACTWQICRDRAKALLHMHELGHDKKLFKNSQSHHDCQHKEALIVALRKTLPEKPSSVPKKALPPLKKLKTSPPLQPLRPLLKQDTKQENTSPNPAAPVLPSAATALKTGVAIAPTPTPSRKRKEVHVDAGLEARLRHVVTVLEKKIKDDMDARATDLRVRQQEVEMHTQVLRYLQLNMHNTASAVQEKLVALVERKMSFDIEHRARDLELRQAEIEFQNQLLRFLTHGA
ncbi:hypothetical protein ACHHYP_12894 [Achlya hypogyna]|uniref:Uncharacterized protein n=1 Tax=Achlya hypogyna TaxID=1202772 RepID=A0A1V9ZGK0_ACHHY|nr:hypothetical protein ACHHYP_12894 [Achlya hypogyna]